MFGSRVFDQDGEEKIWLYVKHQGNSPELAAVYCRTTKATIYAAINRVKKLFCVGPDLAQPRTQ